MAAVAGCGGVARETSIVIQEDDAAGDEEEGVVTDLVVGPIDRVGHAADEVERLCALFLGHLRDVDDHWER